MYQGWIRVAPMKILIETSYSHYKHIANRGYPNMLYGLWPTTVPHIPAYPYSVIPKWWSTWWRHQMETFSALPNLFEGNPSVAGGFSSQRLLTRSFGVFLDQRLNKRLSKQSRRRWFETPSRSIWRQCKEHTSYITHMMRLYNNVPLYL